MTKLDRIRQSLADLLPSQRDCNLICEGSSSWLLVHAIFQHSPEFGKSYLDPMSSQPFFDLSAISKGNVTLIARTLLFLTVCLQQMPADFDSNKLQLTSVSGSIDAHVEKYLATVSALLTSDDEIISSIEGLECLILQGLYHTNAGNLRRSWLTFRRALNVGQLMGIHKAEHSNSISGGRMMWYQIVRADRFLALLLGLPCGSSEDTFEPHENFQNPEINKDLLFLRKLSTLAGRIITRNQVEFAHAFASTQAIDEQLDSLANEMPKSWWEVPETYSTDRHAAAIEFDRIMMQIWYYQLEALLHLPFMLKAATERRYNYSQFVCLKASREMIWRYLSLRQANISSFCCKAIDFAAFTATVTVLLSLLEPIQGGEGQDALSQRVSDKALVKTIQESMEELAANSKDVVATQSAEVIKVLLRVNSSCALANGNLRLTIPYFGTINIAPTRTSDQAAKDIVLACPGLGDSKSTPSSFVPSPLQPTPQHQRLGKTQTQTLTPPMTWQTPPPFQPFTSENVQNIRTTSPHLPQQSQQPPIISFTSSQFQFPMVTDQTMDEWGLQGQDHSLLFDSLLGSDIEGNWMF